MEQGKLAQLRQLVRDAVSVPRVVESTESQAKQAFQLYEFNATPLYVEQTRQARAIREVNRVATWYGLQAEVGRALDAAGASCLTGLGEEDLDRLVARMRLLEDCVQNGGDAPDAPAAR
ncbi:MAG TPA: hypothetical protein VGD42_08855 [Lysobacter sp.]